MLQRYVLITNLDHVAIGNVHTYTNALVLHDKGEHTGARYQARGFHNDACSPTFSIEIPSIEFTIAPILFDPRFPHVETFEHSPLRRGGMMTFAGASSDGPALQLAAHGSNNEGLDIQRWECERPTADFVYKVWAQLTRSVLRYYGAAPYIVLGEQHEVADLRRRLDVVAAERS